MAKTTWKFVRAEAWLKNGWRVAAFSLCILLFSSGCHLRPDFWSPPGNLETQRSRAAVFDPFPDNDAGPSLYGNRPQGFSSPRSEPWRYQQDSPFANQSRNNPF